MHIKALTGGDPITARFMRQDFFTYANFKLFIAGNHKPGLRNVDEAIRRRLHLIPFEVKIPPEERDKNLAEKLRPEWPGILAWKLKAFGMAARWPRTTRGRIRATDAYLEAEDAMATWLQECCTLGPMYQTTTADLFASWRGWAQRSGEPEGSQKRFSQSLQAHGFEPSRQGGTGRAAFDG